MHRPSLLSAAALAVIVAAVPAHAQGDRASILGQITDGSGAAIAGAVVTVSNTGTKERRTATAGASGDYEVPALNIGLYEVAIEQPDHGRCVGRTAAQTCCHRQILGQANFQWRHLAW